jgi:hypothetical protein
MISPVRLSPRLWILVPLAALAFIAWMGIGRAKRVEQITALGNPAVSIDPASPTGYAGGLRLHIAPGHNNESYQWIAQTQQMFADGTWRLRHVTYDNAPVGRSVTTPSPYRWWLAAVARGERAISGRPIGLAVERAALWADPLLHTLFLIGAVAFVRWRFGRLSAALTAVGVALLFPLAGGFVPGAPDARNLTHVVLFASVGLLLAGIFVGEQSARARRAWFFGAGVVGGGALWLSVAVTPVLPAICVGAAAVAWLTRRASEATVLPWRAWSYGGALGTVAAFLIEYAPAHLDLKAFRLTEVHPLYAVAWLGAGELVSRVNAWIRGQKPSGGAWVALFAAIVAFASLPVAMKWTQNPGFLVPQTFESRLTLLDGGAEAKNFAALIVHGGLTGRLAATALPLLLLGVGVWLAWRRGTVAGTAAATADDARVRARRMGFTLLLGPLFVVFCIACAQLSWWSVFDLFLLAVLILAGTNETLAEKGTRPARWLLGACLTLLPAVFVLWPPQTDPAQPAVSHIDVQSLLERDLAHWLARRVGPDGGIALAPPSLTTSLFFHGGVRGLGSPYRENEDGFRASVRIAGATSADEAHALARQRQLTHIVMPSWDPFLDEYARLGSPRPEHTLMGLLHNWLPPRWLKPVSFQLPNVPGFEGQSAVVFEVTELQDHSVALSRLAEYFIEMGRANLAQSVSRTLAEAYPADLIALVARAHTALALRDRPALPPLLASIREQLDQAFDEGLPWDRRVSLCLALAQGGEAEAAKLQAERCMEEVGELELRSLSAASLHRFLTLCRALGVELPDAELRQLGRELLPPELRGDV